MSHSKLMTDLEPKSGFLTLIRDVVMFTEQKQGGQHGYMGVRIEVP